MRGAFILLVCFIIPLTFLNGGNGGIKVKVSQVSFYQHDRAKGLNALEASAGHKLDVTWNEMNSTPAFVGGRLTGPGYSVSSNRPEDGKRFLSENSELFGLKDPEKELSVVSSLTDELGMTHVKYGQYSDNIKVYYSDIIVHFNNDGSIESVNGSYVPTPEIKAAPKISAEASISLARSKIDFTPLSQRAELVIYQKDNLPLLAYEVSLPGKDYPKMKFFIDAVNGSIIKTDDGLRYDGPAKGKGIGLDGTVKNLETYLAGGKYYMIDATLPMYVPPVDSLIGVIQTYDAYNDTAGNGYKKAAFVTDPNGDNNFNDDERLKAAVDAHVYSRMVYNFYKSHYNRNSFDNLGTTLINVVHYKDKFNNAFWNGALMAYGDGDGKQFSNLAGGIDVIGHEITHGVIDNSAALVYELQPGAINESIADAFGSLMDSTDWQIGEDVATPGIPGDAIRTMSDPHNGRPVDDIMNGWQPSHMSEFRIYPNDADHDHGGVHVNSGIMNKAFYNVATVTGHWKAGKIWYRSLTVYLTKNSQFTDFRLACLNSAKDLYGAASSEYKAVSDGFSAVGLGDPPPPPKSTELAYDDGVPENSVYEDYPSWQLGVRFTPPVKPYSVTQVQVYIAGDHYPNGTGQYKLGIYKADPVTGLPGISWMPPGNQIPVGIGWQKYDIFGGGTYSEDFYVTVLYDGAGYPLIGADNPPGNGKAYEYDLTKRAWVKLLSPNDYTLFMRATVKSTTSVSEIDTKTPSEFSLEQNYPNPFNPSTTIRYSLPSGTDVKIIIYDLEGRKIAELVNNYQMAGSYSVTWNGNDDSGQRVSSGVYYYNIKAGSFEKTNKMCLMK